MDIQQESLLIARFRAPATKIPAFTEIVQSCNTSLFRHLCHYLKQKEDVEDVLQQVWIKAWQGLENFRGDSRLKTWLFTIANNEAISFIRKKKIGVLALEDHHADKAQLHSPNSEEVLLLLQKAIQTLPEKQQLVFTMRYFEEMPYEEMSAITGTSVGALKASYHHAVKKVEEFLKR